MKTLRKENLIGEDKVKKTEKEQETPYILPTTAFLVEKLNMVDKLQKEVFEEISNFIKEKFPEIDSLIEEQCYSKNLKEKITVSTLAQKTLQEKIDGYEKFVEAIEEMEIEQGCNFPSGDLANDYIELCKKEIQMFSVFFSLKNKKKNPVVKKEDIERAFELFESTIRIIILEAEKHGVFDQVKKNLEQARDEPKGNE